MNGKWAGLLAVWCHVTRITASLFWSEHFECVLSISQLTFLLHWSSLASSSFHLWKYFVYPSASIFTSLHVVSRPRASTPPGSEHWSLLINALSRCHARDVCSSQTVELSSSITSSSSSLSVNTCSLVCRLTLRWQLLLLLTCRRLLGLLLLT